MKISTIVENKTTTVIELTLQEKIDLNGAQMVIGMMLDNTDDECQFIGREAYDWGELCRAYDMLVDLQNANIIRVK